MTFCVTLNDKEKIASISISVISADELRLRICDPNICASIAINKQELQKAIEDIMAVFYTYG